MDRIDALEKWRIDHGLSKTEMAARMGCNSPQQYGNWVARGSLPKDYFERADRLLGVKTEYRDSAFSTLTPEQKRKAVRSLLSSLDSDERAWALAFLIELD